MTKHRLLWRIVGVVALLVVAVGAILYGRFTGGMAEAHAAFRRLDFPSATARYDEVLSTFGKYQVLKRLFRGRFETAVIHRAQLLFHQGQYRETVEILEQQGGEFRQLAGAPLYHLWMGNALFRVAVLQEGADLSLESLETVAEAYREALRLDPVNWDAKHNYEFVRLLQERKKSGLAKDEKNLQLLLGEIRLTTEQQRGGVPEKPH